MGKGALRPSAYSMAREPIQIDVQVFKEAGISDILKKEGIEEGIVLVID